jgi:hypothetical protein
MKPFSRLISFGSRDGKARYFADLGMNEAEVPTLGTSIDAYTSFADLVEGKNKVTAIVEQVITPTW